MPLPGLGAFCVITYYTISCYKRGGSSSVLNPSLLGSPTLSLAQAQAQRGPKQRKRRLQPRTMENDVAKTVKDVSPHEFVKAYSAHLKRSGKVRSILFSFCVCFLSPSAKSCFFFLF